MEFLIILLGVLIGYELCRMAIWISCLRKVSGYADESSVNTLLIFNSSFRIEKVIKYDKDIFGYMKEELLKRSLWNLFSHDIVARFFEGYKQALLGNETVDIKFIMKEEDESSIYIAKFIPMKNGHIACLIQPVQFYQTSTVFPQGRYLEVVNAPISQSLSQNAI